MDYGSLRGFLGVRLRRGADLAPRTPRADLAERALPALAQVDVPVERPQLHLRPAAADGAADFLLDFEAVLAALALLLDLCGRLGELDVEIGVDLAVVGAHAQVAAEAARQADVDVAVQGSERQRRLGAHSRP